MVKTLIFALLATMCATFLWGCGGKVSYTTVDGTMLGTTLHVVADVQGTSPQELYAAVMALDREAKASMSIFDPASLLSRLNRNETDSTDALFQKMYAMALQVNRKTEGAFDITVGPLVNAWGFGFKQNSFPDSARIDTLRQFVGMDLLTLTEGKLQKKYPEITLDASSIAKGLGVDLVAEYFERKGLNDYMVEIGGEVRAKGQSSKKRPWRIGIDRPEEDVTARNRRLQMIAGLSQGALATSGNYRNFYVHDGKKYAHTINPKTGYPVQTEGLSASVYAPTCMEADAYATAFMVLGLQKARQIVLADPELEGAFIYLEEGKMKNWISPGFEKLIVEK